MGAGRIAWEVLSRRVSLWWEFPCRRAYLESAKNAGMRLDVLLGLCTHPAHPPPGHAPLPWSQPPKQRPALIQASKNPSIPPSFMPSSAPPWPSLLVSAARRGSFLLSAAAGLPVARFCPATMPFPWASPPPLTRRIVRPWRRGCIA